MGCKFADHVIVISNVIKDLIAQRCGRTKNVSLVYNGVPVPEICEYHLPSDIKLVLAGDTDFEDDYSRGLKQMARENGVVLTGFIRGKKLHSLLTNALCYSLPSSHEGLPIALLEAMSYRLPVITSAIPANLEVGLDSSCYHEVGDVPALASKLETIINQPLQRIDYDMTKYNWDTIATQVHAIYAITGARAK